MSKKKSTKERTRNIARQRKAKKQVKKRRALLARKVKQNDS